MPDRKTAIWQHADAIVALPGGIGTLDELSEALSLKQLGILRHPIVIINLDGYYDQLLRMLEGFIEEQFMSPVFGDMFRVVNSVEDIIPAILEQDNWSATAAQKHTHI